MICSRKSIKLGIIGCGAIAEKGYLPASNLVSNIVLTHVVDLDLDRAERVAKHFHIPDFVDDYRFLYGKVDAVVVATPPNSHAPISIDCLNHGLHVLCEKPLAPSVREGEEMIAVSRKTGRHLAVGMIRRLSPSFQLLKRALETDMLGEIRGFDLEEGSQFNWPLRTGHLFQDKISGGVLADTGPHVLDLLLWLFGSESVNLVNYSDDRWGGVEANALIELEIELGSRKIIGTVDLSFNRRLRNTVRIYGEKGWLEAPAMGGSEIRFHLGKHERDVMILKHEGSDSRKLLDNFATQLSSFADSLINNSRNYVEAHEALPALSLIEECRNSRKMIAHPWEIKHLESFFSGKMDES